MSKHKSDKINEDNNADKESIEYHCYHTSTELDYDRHYCTESTQIEQDFVGDVNDYENLSLNTPKVTDWNTKMMLR